MKNDEKYMRIALGLAQKALDRTYPNPMVGAVVVKNGRIVAKGYHRKAGMDHAEVDAIKHAKGSLKGSTIYVTLEPCDHFGKTPPCTGAIIKSGIKEVVIAMKDPNPINNGRGIKRLKAAGIKVRSGIMEKESRKMGRKYIKFIVRKMPYITVKSGQSLDGKIAASDGSSKWITSEASRKYVKNLRSSFDAIITVTNTALNDDPSLLPFEVAGRPGPARVVLDASLRISERSNLVKTLDRAPLILAVTEKAPEAKIKRFEKMNGVKLLIFRSEKGRIPLKKLLIKLAEMKFVNILVESGGELTGSLMDGGFVDEWIFFIAPKVIGGTYSSVKGRGALSIKNVPVLKDVIVKKIGADLFVRGTVCSPE